MLCTAPFAMDWPLSQGQRVQHIFRCYQQELSLWECAGRAAAELSPQVLGEGEGCVRAAGSPSPSSTPPRQEQHGPVALPGDPGGASAHHGEAGPLVRDWGVFDDRVRAASSP